MEYKISEEEIEEVFFVWNSRMGMEGVESISKKQTFEFLKILSQIRKGQEEE